MPTRQITLTADWQQIADGTEDKLLQVLRGSVFLTESDDIPDINAKGYLLRANTESSFATLTPPSVVWCRSAVFDNAEIVI